MSRAALTVDTTLLLLDRSKPVQQLPSKASDAAHMNTPTQTPVHSAVLECLARCSASDVLNKDVRRIVRKRCAEGGIKRATCIVELTVRHLLETLKSVADRRIRFDESGPH